MNLSLDFGLWILTFYAELVIAEEFEMEEIGGGEFATEGEVVGQVSVPNYVHPNTHISGSSETRFMQDCFSFGCLPSIKFLFSSPSLFRYSVLTDNLHLRDGHLPLHILCLLLEGGGG